MCGENYFVWPPHYSDWGSPPHVRGKPNFVCGSFASLRITPACAGKTTVSGSENVLERDHPRMCGENCASVSASYAVKGSPPHVRGKRCHLPNEGDSIGITPACAGKT